jgi:predicted aspartyl protease
MHGLTVKATGISRIIVMDIAISLPSAVAKAGIKGIWDTGATSTVITQNVVNALGLVPTGKTLVNTASANNVQTNTYLVDVHLPNGLTVKDVIVTLGIIMPGIDCLIGMDIITLGDFTITNHAGQTCMSFRVPSQNQVDYVVEINKVNRRNYLYRGTPKKKRTK